MPLTSENKQILLRLIRDNKKELFGEFSATITKDKRIACWKKVVSSCKEEYGFDPCPGKDYTYVRDVLWPNLKRRTLEKVDSVRRTGAAGGPECKLNDIQELVLDILDKRSGIVVGLAVPETYEPIPAVETAGAASPTEAASHTESPVLSDDPAPTTSGAGQGQRRKIRSGQFSSHELEDLKKRKVEMQIRELELRSENWQLRNAKLRIEIANLTGPNDLQYCML